MSRRYYCDYCDKSFIDDIGARKKHLQSAHHIKLRNIHYELNRDPYTVLQEESAKTQCRRFMQTGDCQFAGNCKYSHYTQQELWKLRQDLETHDRERMQKQFETSEVPDAESWLVKYKAKNSGSDDLKTVQTVWTYPTQLEMRTDLPPSIKKFSPEDFVDGDFAEWGE